MPLFKSGNIRKLKANNDINGLVNLLRYDDSPRVRRSALKALVEIASAEAFGESGEPRAVISLVEVLHPYDMHVTPDIADAIAKIGDKRAVKPLIKILKDKTGYIGPSLKALVSAILGDLGDKRAVPSLIFQAKHSLFDEEREAAAIALKKLDDPRAAEVIAKYDQQKKKRQEEQEAAAKMLNKVLADYDRQKKK